MPAIYQFVFNILLDLLVKVLIPRLDEDSIKRMADKVLDVAENQATKNSNDWRWESVRAVAAALRKELEIPEFGT